MPGATSTKKDFLSILDFDATDLERCLQLSARLKAERSLGRQAPTADAIDGRHIALLFEKPSLRTRSTFEIAVRELGGHIMALQSDVALGGREPVEDVARNLERWVDGVVIRTYSQKTLEQFAKSAPKLHVINALTDQQHPCQAIADFLGPNLVHRHVVLQPAHGRARARFFAAGAVLAEQTLPGGESDLEISMPRQAFEDLCRTEGLELCLDEPAQPCAPGEPFLQSRVPTRWFG